MAPVTEALSYQVCWYRWHFCNVW